MRVACTTFLKLVTVLPFYLNNHVKIVVNYICQTDVCEIDKRQSLCNVYEYVASVSVIRKTCIVDI